MVAPISRDFLVPSGKMRDGCPCSLTPTVRVTTQVAGDRLPLVEEFSRMRFEHLGKDGRPKVALDLGPVHRALEVDALSIQRTGAANVLVCRVSFETVLRDETGAERREFITFPLRIPGCNLDSKDAAVLNYSSLLKMYGSRERLFGVLGAFYHLGRSLANPQGKKHGHVPGYDAGETQHDQYIMHSEQFLVAYLATPEGALMLSKRLRATIRGNFPEVVSAKVSNIGVHLHSTMTCCAPCEYTLLGLMNCVEGHDSLIANLTRALRVPHEHLSFRLPERSPFRMHVTVGVSDHDADHRQPPTKVVVPLAAEETAPYQRIDVKNPVNARRIFCAFLPTPYDQRLLPEADALTDLTVLTSGSAATVKNKGTTTKLRAVRGKTSFDGIGLLF